MKTQNLENRLRDCAVRSHRAFTRLDLAGAVAMTALLLLALSPAIARTRVNDRSFVCLNNLRQLVAAWRMYAEDNQDRLVPNLSTAGQTGGWVDGWEDWLAGNYDNTNVWLLLNAKLGPYTRQASIYKCPADTYLCLAGGRPMPRVRSVSMNGFIGSSSASSWYGWRSYNKFSDIQTPAPAGLWVITEEHPDSINDGCFWTDVTNPHDWVDLPASLHEGACNFGFADGHIEPRKWFDKTTLRPVWRIAYNGSATSFDNDTKWLIQRSSSPLQ